MKNATQKQKRGANTIHAASPCIVIPSGCDRHPASLLAAGRESVLFPVNSPALRYFFAYEKF